MLMEIPANPDPGKVNHVWYALTSVSDADVARVWEARANPWPAWDHLPEAITRRDDWQPMFPKHSLELLVEGIAADAGKSGP